MTNEQGKQPLHAPPKPKQGKNRNKITTNVKVTIAALSVATTLGGWGLFVQHDASVAQGSALEDNIAALVASIPIPSGTTPATGIPLVTSTAQATATSTATVTISTPTPIQTTGTTIQATETHTSAATDTVTSTTVPTATPTVKVVTTTPSKAVTTTKSSR